MIEARHFSAGSDHLKTVASLRDENRHPTLGIGTRHPSLVTRYQRSERIDHQARVELVPVTAVVEPGAGRNVFLSDT